MSDDSTPRLMLPLLVPGQAQKELYHNEALALLDIAVQAVVRGVGASLPPTSPTAGESWILGAAPTGAWSDYPLHLAGWTSGGWRFLAPREGMMAWSIADSTQVWFSAGGWTIGEQRCARIVIADRQVVGAQRPAVPAPSGGTTVDVEARAVLVNIIGALAAHGLIAG